jgi:hypothetical protein
MKSRRRILSTHARTFKGGLKETHNSFQRLSQVTKCGFMGTTQKSNSSHFSGRAQNLHTQKGNINLLKCEEHDNCFFFWALKQLWIMNLFHKGKLYHQHYYNDILQCLWESVKWNWPAKVEFKELVFPPWQSLTHSALSVREFLAKNMTVVPHPPYSPDLVPCDIFPFPKLNMVWKGRRFNDVTMIQAKSWDTLAVFQTTNFRKSLEWWHDCFTHCIKCQGAYFEGDNIS